MHILITGGSGLIGRHLTQSLLVLDHQVSVVTRSPAKARKALDERITLYKGLNDFKNLDGFDAVINLAGEPVAERRWSEEQKQRLCQSRWQITEKLVKLFKASESPPAVLLSGSATGYYGDQGEAVVTEDEAPHSEFTHHLCARWEQLASKAQSATTRVCLLRTGVVLAPQGGMLTKMAPLFRLGLGGPLGHGRQYLPWIHIEDMVNGIIWLLNNDLHGPFNMVSPWPVRNEQFAHALGQTLKRPALLRVPSWIIKLMLGEAAVLVLGGQRALPQRLEASGFGFRYSDLEEALHDLLT